ncbi:inhibitor of host transcription [Salmonella phage vB_SnwM_CGG4-1]|uniref:Inhibitor of host transcription n=1 Tax=Salmonella phage vB_SnwM_CGG4-1 TaxID=1815631 RepID=A0A1B0VW21_9CAUD|nr:inhibitor of host transcription [Salmonella phage vB_SnwM_CGG4-1]ANA49564.1 inhibitor of host transcription [Salmonella phage vB_SnwM_CGG4-1]
MNLQLITNEALVEKYGTHHDGISVFKGSRRVGYLTDLRKAFAADQKKRKKQKEYNNKVTEARQEAMPEAVEEMKNFLENQLTKYGAEVIINITQPNVLINDCKCYITVDPIYGKHRLGIHNPYMDSSEMADEIQGFKVSQSDAPNHVLWNGLSQDDIVEVIVKLCK